MAMCVLHESALASDEGFLHGEYSPTDYCLSSARQEWSVALSRRVHSLERYLGVVSDHICCSLAIESARSEEHTSELQSLMRISYAVFCLKKKNKYVEQTQYK